MKTNKKYPTVKVGYTIHSKRMKELAKGKRWVGSFENEFALLMLLQSDKDNSIESVFTYKCGISEGYYKDKKITNRKEAFEVLCQMGITALKTTDWNAIKEFWRLWSIGDDGKYHYSNGAVVEDHINIEMGKAESKEDCRRHIKNAIKNYKGSLSKEEVIMAHLIDHLNDAVGEFVKAQFRCSNHSHSFRYIEMFYNTIVFIEVLRTHYLKALNKILKNIDKATHYLIPISKDATNEGYMGEFEEGEYYLKPMVVA